MTSPSTDRLTGCRWRERERTLLTHVRGLHEFVNRHACTNPTLVMTRLQEFSDVNPPPSPPRPLTSMLSGRCRASCFLAACARGGNRARVAFRLRKASSVWPSRHVSEDAQVDQSYISESESMCVRASPRYLVHFGERQLVRFRQTPCLTVPV